MDIVNIGAGVQAVRIEISPRMIKFATEQAEKMSKVPSNKIQILCAMNQQDLSDKEKLVRGNYTGKMFEAGVRVYLRKNARNYTAPDKIGNSDDGQDVKIAAGWMDCKGEYREPDPFRTLKVKVISQCVKNPEIKYFPFGFVGKGYVYFVGVETRENVIKEENIKKSRAGNFYNYEVRADKLSIKPWDLLKEPYTYPRNTAA